MKQLIERLQIAFRVRLCHLVDNLVIWLTKPMPIAKKMLVIRLDAIGDYVLFRNFLEEIALQYPTHQKTLCGNVMWKNLFESWDYDKAFEGFWIDRKKFYLNPFYRFKKQKQLRKAGFEVVIEPTYSRLLLFGDAIVKISGANKKVGNSGNTDNLIPKEKKLADSYYTELIYTPEKPIFEFDRNKLFFENFFDRKLELKAPFILPYTRQAKTNNKQISLFVGASEEYKRWSWKNFAELIYQLHQKDSTYSFFILGAKNEQQLAIQILAYLEKKQFNLSLITDLTGKTSLIDLTKQISVSEWLITNETVASHLGAATDTPTICIANGRHIGRFSPYPNTYKLPIFYIFPPRIENELATQPQEQVYERYCNTMGLAIDEISVEQILAKMDN